MQQAVLRLLDEFPQTVKLAAQKNEPSYITRFSCELAKAVNRFYYEHRILDADASDSAARLMLTRAARTTIKTALSLLGIAAPEKM